ncbi:MAG: ribose 5-phosphate isomerase B [Syntrophales bacterium]|nr:ribose 5-phosphate isomerase B [Syntrophales bacterium]
MNIAIGSDHGGFALKEDLKAWLIENNHGIQDAGTDNSDPVDYPDFVGAVAQGILSGSVDRGILICGSGIGMSIAANRFPGIRAALCLDVETARLSRAHNDSNVLVLAGRKTDGKTARSIVDVWLTAEFEGNRHIRRLQKIETLKRPFET